MPSLLKMDQINRLLTELEQKIRTSEYTDNGIRRFKIKKEDFCDSLLDILIMSYAFGNESANEDLNATAAVNIDKMQKSIYYKIDGKDWQQRVNEYIDNNGTVDDIIRVAKTESHRNINSGAYDTAVDVEDMPEDVVEVDTEQPSRKDTHVYKTWRCQMLPASRDTHVYLSGTKVGVNDYFYTYAGNSTLYPGQFGVAEEDVNCMCTLKFSRE